MAFYNWVDDLTLDDFLPGGLSKLLLGLFHLVVVKLMLFLNDLSKVSYPPLLDLFTLCVEAERSLHREQDKDVAPHAFPV